MAGTISAYGYYRLSCEDGDKSESDSITSQRLIAEEYAKEHNLMIVEEFADDGYTGTNFDRPGFRKMMESVREGSVHCIIIKDFSRLGRNYIEMGKLMTRLLPSLGVRLISVVDHYDSVNEDNRADQLIVPFKNLLNDAYCRDISLKVRSQMDIKRKKGKYVGSFAVYGYKKDENDRNQLVIDETAAKVVEMIFNLRLDGYSTGKIADMLNEYGIETPSSYKRSCGMNYTSGLRTSIKTKWQPGTVKMILDNRVYTGSLVQGRSRKVNYKVKKEVKLPRSQWIIVPNTHEPIISQATFNQVNSLNDFDTRTSPEEDKVHFLSGLVKCADCGQNMVRRSVTRCGKKYYYYHCSSSKKKSGCSSHMISEKKIIESVFYTIKNVLSQLETANNKLSGLQRLSKDNVSVSLLTKQIEEQLNETEKYKKMKVRLYQDYSEGIVSKDEYIEINKNFSEKISELEEITEANRSRKEQLMNLECNRKSWIKEFLEEKNIKELNRRCCIRLLEKVSVRADKSIECEFKYNSELTEMLRIAVEV